MIWIPLLVFLSVLAAVAGAYFFVASRRTERLELRRRLSLLELRGIEQADMPEVLKSELLSNVPPLNRILSRLAPAVRLDRRLKQADLNINVGAFVLLTALFFAAGALAGSFLRWPFVLSLLAGVGLALLPSLVVGIKKRIRLKKFVMHFPDALDMFARSLRAGHSFSGAVQLVAQEMPDPIGVEFQKIFDEQNLGIPLRQALIGITQRIESLDVKFFVTAILIQRETGGNLAEILDKIAHVIRERFRIQGQLRIFTAQARLTGGILGCLPIGMVFLISMLNPDYLKPLWFDRMGRFLVVMAVLLQVTGGLVIRRIIRIKI